MSQRKGFHLNNLEEAVQDSNVSEQEDPSEDSKGHQKDDEMLEKITDALVIAFVIASVFKILQYCYETFIA